MIVMNVLYMFDILYILGSVFGYFFGIIKLFFYVMCIYVNYFF